jgi:membrane protease YdiL (CAAX protease family)
MLTSVVFTFIFLVFIFLFQRGGYIPSHHSQRPVREILEAGLIAGCLLAVRFIHFDLFWLSGWQSAYLVFGLLAPIVMEWGVRHRNLSAIGFRMPANMKTITLVAVLFCIYLVARLVIPPLLGATFTFSWQGFFSYSIIFPFVEEVIFRGMIQTRLEAAWGSVRAWIISGLFFGFHHYYIHYLVTSRPLAVTDILELVYLTAFGMVLGVIYAKTRSLLPSYLVHAINNLTLFPME